jgi:hypothetical protein
MRFTYSYARLFIGSWFFMGGVALQFVPSAAADARNARWRERQLTHVQPDQREKWIEDRDTIDSNSQAYEVVRRSAGRLRFRNGTSQDGISYGSI